METIFMSTEKTAKANETHKFVLNLSQGLDLGSSNKHIVLQNFSIYCTRKNIRKQYKNNRLKIIAPTLNDEFELPDGFYSVSNIQVYIEFIIKKHTISTTIAPIHVSIKRIDNRLVLKIKDGYKLELQTPETMKLFGTTKKLIVKRQNKKWRKSTKS